MTEDMQANLEFMKQELIWTVLEPRLVRVYVDVYTEDELSGGAGCIRKTAARY